MQEIRGRLFLYIMFCYFFLTFGYTIVAGLGYHRLMKEDQDKSQSLSKSGEIQVVQECDKKPCILRYNFSRYYSRHHIRRLVVWILVVSPFLVLGIWGAFIKLRNRSSCFRGLSYVILFGFGSLAPPLIVSNFQSFSATVLIGAGFLGALFWWIDNTHTKSKAFDNALYSIAEIDDARVERINILFQDKKAASFMTYTLFALVVVSLGVTTSQIYITHYKIKSVCSLHICYFCALIFLGSLGMLGGVATEFSRQINEIIKVLGKK
jgi:hypothetical protein